MCALLTLTGCGRDHRILDDGCELSDEVVLAELLGPSPHDIVLLGERAPTHIAWSERAGLFMRAIGDGEATTVRLGPPCEAGLASEGVRLACARRGDDAKGQRGHVIVLDAISGAVIDRVEGVGPDSSGVSFATAEGAHVLVWNDTRETTATVWMRRDETDARRLSRAGVRAGQPAVRFETTDTGPRLVVTWPETWLGRDGLEGTLRLQRGERVTDLEPLAYDDAHPTLTLDDAGAPVVVLRDRRPARTRPRLFVRRLDRNDTAHDGVHANAEGEALAVPCAGALVLVAPRTHSRTERLVAVRRHDLRTLEGAGPEHQIYMHGAAFEHADARCDEGELVVAVASEASLERPRGTISTVRFRCPDVAVE